MQLIIYNCNVNLVIENKTTKNDSHRVWFDDDDFVVVDEDDDDVDDI
jgi:hypothetical protein